MVEKFQKSQKGDGAILDVEEGGGVCLIGGNNQCSDRKVLRFN